MVDDVLTPSERGYFNREGSNQILSKYDSIKGKEQILQECGVLKDPPKKAVLQLKKNI